LSDAPPKLYEPTIYIDLEGVNLCRQGSLSILTLLIDTPTIRVCFIDVHSLGSQAFNTTGIKGKTLKDILQNEKILKDFFRRSPKIECINCTFWRGTIRGRGCSAYGELYEDEYEFQIVFERPSQVY
jgi:hypothetical protein